MATPTSLPASFTAGQVLTAAQMNNIRGAFRILQVVYGSTTTAASSSVTTYADTNLTASITPSATSSKILVCVFQNGGVATNGGSGLMLRVLRGATNIGQIGDGVGFNAQHQLATISSMILDEPATTSATTYKTQFANRAAQASVSVQNNSALSTIVLMEVSA